MCIATFLNVYKVASNTVWKGALINGAEEFDYFTKVQSWAAKNKDRQRLKSIGLRKLRV